MTRLKMLHIHFLSPTSRPVSRGTPQSPPIRATLPALNYFEFHDCSEYLECLLSGIDTPLLKYIYLTFFNQLIFDTPQLFQFIHRTHPQRSHDEAMVYFSGTDISITFTQLGTPHCMRLQISCRPLDWQMSALAEICAHFSLILSGVQRLNIGASSPLPGGQDEIVPHVAHSLAREEMVTGVLPVVQELYIEEHGEFASVREALAPFSATRQRAGRPVIVYRSNSDNTPLPPSRVRTEQTGAFAPFIGTNDLTLELAE
ncbi:hypothetical protein BJV78DRAFT_402554 [Lactifluus subvellereus]|nr:hypothetical protein BJV78DRAFT_402554 [Lactifluus subvellereus]